MTDMTATDGFVYFISSKMRQLAPDFYPTPFAVADDRNVDIMYMKVWRSCPPEGNVRTDASKYGTVCFFPVRFVAKRSEIEFISCPVGTGAACGSTRALLTKLSALAPSVAVVRCRGSHEQHRKVVNSPYPVYVPSQKASASASATEGNARKRLIKQRTPTNPTAHPKGSTTRGQLSDAFKGISAGTGAHCEVKQPFSSFPHSTAYPFSPSLLSLHIPPIPPPPASVLSTFLLHSPLFLPPLLLSNCGALLFPPPLLQPSFPSIILLLLLHPSSHRRVFLAQILYASSQPVPLPGKSAPCAKMHSKLP